MNAKKLFYGVDPAVKFLLLAVYRQTYAVDRLKWDNC
jgi:hypothetical protein